MELKGQYERGDIDAAFKLHVKPRVYQIVLVSIIGFLIACLFVLLTITRRFPWELLVGIGFVGLIFLYWLKIIPAQQVKTTMGRQDINVPFTIQITDKTFHFENEFATTHLPWNFVKKWRKDSKVVILYMQDNMLRVIPLRLVQESERKNLIELISKNQSQFINKSSGAWTRPVIILVIIIISFLFFFFVWKH